MTAMGFCLKTPNQKKNINQKVINMKLLTFSISLTDGHITYNIYICLLKNLQCPLKNVYISYNHNKYRSCHKFVTINLQGQHIPFFLRCFTNQQ